MGGTELKRLGKSWAWAAFAAVPMFVAAGCEPVGGVDVNKALLSSYEVDSREGTMSLAWNLEVDAAATDQESLELLELFGSGRLNVTEYKQADVHRASMEGVLELSKGKLPFAAYTTKDKVVIDVEGAKEPFEIDLGSAYGLDDAGAVFGGFDPSEAITEEVAKEINKAVATFFVGNVPNPEDTSIDRVTETIDGKQKSLRNISFTTRGDEFDELIVKYVENLSADEEGLKSLLGTLYDALKPAIEPMLEENPNPVLDFAFDNKEVAVEFLYEQIAPLLDDLAAQLSEDIGGELSQENGESIFSEDSGLTIELLLDGATLVGDNVELRLAPAEGEDSDGLESVEIRAESRYWNIGGDVEAETYDGETAALDFEAKPRDRLDNIEEGSLLYDILRNDLHVTRHSFDMYMGTNGGVPDGYSPYIKGAGTTMVPVRYVSEQLDAAVSWDGAAQTITIADAEAGTTIVLRIGSRTATVDGVAETLPEAPEIIYDTTYVPIAFITKALGGEASWDGELGIVTITKEF